MSKLDQRVHNMLMISNIGRNLYTYGKDGIYFNYGPYKGKNLSKSYMDGDDNVLEYLENIIDSENAPYKIRVATVEVINDLINNYPSYEFC